jgi:3-oxoacyl-[acyl-carrier-protein] synthase-3
MQAALDKAQINLEQVNKILIHQANEKMDEAIVKRLYRLNHLQSPEGIMPLSIQFLGNSSVATIPTLYDTILKGECDGHEINENDILLFASVGAGMNINAFVYRQ